MDIKLAAIIAITVIVVAAFGFGVAVDGLDGLVDAIGSIANDAQ